ncbi:peptidase M23 [Streptomyces sp. NPDC001339]|uniref:CIS tube protein n=1 Tax=Streptomyces sp. NPDC001339 TaxID=3364563 RepID=UPI00367982D3
MADLVRATLRIFDPPSGTAYTPSRERTKVMPTFNPTELTITKAATWAYQPAAGSTAAARGSFTGAQPKSMSLRLFFDAGAGQESTVQQQVDTLLSCCAPTRASAAKHAGQPPWVRLEWGKDQTTRFNARVLSVQARLTRFGKDGTPLRAECMVTVEEVGGEVPGQNPTSGSLVAHQGHQLVEGENLPLLAYCMYGDPSLWRAVARINGIKDPLRLVPGTVLELPADIWDVPSWAG